MGAVHQLRPPTAETSTADAIASWLDWLPTVRGRSGHFTSPSTVRNYGSAARNALEGVGTVAELDTETGRHMLRGNMTERWGGSSPATWNAKRAAVASFVSYCRERGWITGDPLEDIGRVPQPKPLDRARPREDVARLLDSERAPYVHRALWALAYESFARIDELLSLNVDDLDLRNGRASATRKGGHQDTITWDRGGRAARRLSKLVGDRTSGPVFLTDHQARGLGRGLVPLEDRSPDGRRRLSYREAWAVLKDVSGGWTPHDLRHSATTHAAEDGLSTPLLMAKTGHRDIRSLARYARPSAEAAQAAVENTRRKS